MDIAALSVVMANSQVRQQVSVQLAAKVMDTSKTQADALIRTMEQSVQPNVGKSIDVNL